MPTVTIPANWNWEHWGNDTQGPGLTEAIQQAARDLAALQARGDTAMQAKLDLAIARQTALRTAVDALVGKYNLHIAAAGTHVAADVDNLVAATAATDPTTDILAIINDAYDMYVAHVAMDAGGAGVHPGGADAVNVVTATYPATTEAEAVALLNDIVAMYELHRANNGGAYHTNPDATNTIVEPAMTDWDDGITLANAYKNTTGFNAHVILTAGPVHGATDVAHVITAADCGVQVAALFVELNEFQTDYNAHVAHLGVHPTAGAPDATAVATTEATAVALLAALGTALNTHIASADDHLDADATTTPVALVPTEYEDAIAAAAQYRAAYDAHRILGPALHSRADAANTGAAVGAGGDVAALGAGGVVTIGLVNA